MKAGFADLDLNDPFSIIPSWTAAIPVMCLQVRDRDRNGVSINEAEAAELAAIAYSKARRELEKDAVLDLISNDYNFSGINTDATSLFKFEFKNELINQFGGGVTINYYPCQGNIPQSSMRKADTVVTARSGVVIEIKEDIDYEKSNLLMSKEMNYVEVLQKDGTIGKYQLFKKGGIFVEEGNRIIAGQPLGTIDSEHYEHGPHVRFQVYYA